MTPFALPRTCLLLALVFPSACTRVEGDAGNGATRPPFWSAQAATNRYGFEEWYGDFPYPPPVPAVRKPGAWYSKSRMAALRQVAANLEGTCSPAAWHMAKEFFDRCQDEAQAVLIENMDRGLTQKLHGTLALNTVKVMGRVKNPTYADALLRAVEHPDASIREQGVASLVKGGNADVVRKVGGYYLQLTLKERLNWMKACLAHLPDQELVPILRDLMSKQEHSYMRLPALEECLKMSPARAVKLLSPAYDDLPEQLRMMAAPAFHAVGDPRGLGTLRMAMRGSNRALQAVAVDGARSGKIEPLVDEILQLTNQDLTNSNDDVVLLVAIMNTLQKVPGDRVRDVLLMYTAAVAAPVRQAAYQALYQRGETRELDELLKLARAGTGTQRANAIADLVSCRYEKVLPVMMEFYKKAAATEQMWYIRELARYGSKPAFAPMKKIFMEPERKLPTRSDYTTVTFLGIQFSNMHESIDEIIGLLESLPRQDYRRRAALVHAVANVAGARSDDPWTKDVYAALRRIVFNPKEVPQLRLLALDYLRKDLRLEDAMNLKRALRKESPQMRSYFSDYLLEYF